MAQFEPAVATTEMPQVQDLAESLHDGPPPAPYILPQPMSEVPEQLPEADVPVVDLSKVASDPDEAAKLKSALESWGLFHGVGHGIPLALLDTVLEAGRGFFRLSPEEKRQYFTGELEGYGSNYVVFADKQVLNWKDQLFLTVHPAEQRKPHLWPDTPADFSESLSEYADKTKDLVHSLLVVMARLLPGLEEDNFLEQLGANPKASASFNYYPRCTRPELVFGIKPHTDGPVLTVLLPDPEVDGLQVLQDGKWFRAPSVPGAVIINVGDQMEIMSNGEYKSSIHRVVTNPRKERISVTMFYDADMEQVIGPAEALVGDGMERLYRDVVVKDYVEHFFHTFYDEEKSIDWAKATGPSTHGDVGSC